MMAKRWFPVVVALASLVMILAGTVQLEPDISTIWIASLPKSWTVAGNKENCLLLPTRQYLLDGIASILVVVKKANANDSENQVLETVGNLFARTSTGAKPFQLEAVS